MEITSKFITDLAIKIQAGQKVEEDKLDLKASWYDLRSNEEEQQEFAKDIAAIANTPGPTGYIIIGLDEKTGIFQNAPFSQSNLKDEADLHNIIVKRVDFAPNIELKEHKIEFDKQHYLVSVITIPPSQDKPHVVKHYKSHDNYIPIRKTTGTYPATRSDIEYMYYDRKEILHAFRLEIHIYSQELEARIGHFQGGYMINLPVQTIIQNTGIHSIAITQAKLILEYQGQARLLPESMDGLLWEKPDSRGVEFPRPLIIEPHAAKDIKLVFKALVDTNDIDTIRPQLSSSILCRVHLILTSSSGQAFHSEIAEVTIRG